MKALWNKFTKGCHNFIAYAVAILILAVAIFVPVTIVAWCIQFWILLI